MTGSIVLPTGLRSGPTAVGRRPRVAWIVFLSLAASPLVYSASAAEPEIRVGIIGLDTSHVVAFTTLLNRDDAPDRVPGARVVAAFPQGSRDIESSVARVPEYTGKLRDLGVEMVPSIAALVERVDAVMLESNDGRVHLEQAVPVLTAGKPLFIDKPMAASLADAITIFTIARERRTPVFSASSLRFGPATQAVRTGSIGAVLGCDTYSTCTFEPTHPDLFWYGIHGCESLFTVMGKGCRTVTRTSTADAELVTGVWEGGRIGTFRGLRAGKTGFGGTAFGTTGIAPVGEYVGYRPLVVEIVKFFRTGTAPFDERETVEILAFMEAADESRRNDGRAVVVADVIARAEAVAKPLAVRYLASVPPPPGDEPPP